MIARVGVLVLTASHLGFALVSPDGTGRLPAMGWNSWNEYNCGINETVFLTVGNLLISLGLKDLGYTYVNIDDCWSDKVNQRDISTGKIRPDVAKFPQGIKHTAEEVHKLGLKLGIYSDAGTLTCGGYAGSLNHEAVDAATFAEWGIDCECAPFVSLDFLADQYQTSSTTIVMYPTSGMMIIVGGLRTGLEGLQQRTKLLADQATLPSQCQCRHHPDMTGQPRRHSSVTRP
jgi:hypothetical protein